MVGSLVINRRRAAAAERKAAEDEAEVEWRRLEAELFAS
jgi:hypothetical protein